MRLKIIILVFLVLLFSTITSAFNLGLVEKIYLQNSSIIANLNINITNNIDPDSDLTVYIDNKEVTKTTLKQFMDLSQVRFNVSDSKFSLTGNSFKTKTINQNSLFGLRIAPGLINLADIVVSGSNAKEPRIDINLDNKDEWIFLGDKSSFNSPITATGVDVNNEAGSFVLTTKNTFLCSLIDLPITKDLRIEVKYKTINPSETEKDLEANFFSVGDDSLSAFGGSEKCDLPEPTNTNSEFRSCELKLSQVAEGKHYICVSTKKDRQDAGDLYSIPIDDKADNSFVCSGDVSSGALGCAKAQGGDFLIRVSTGDYNKVLNGNTNFGDWLIFPEAIKIGIQNSITNCQENCIVPFKAKLTSGSLTVNKFLVRSGSFESDSMFDGIFEKSIFTHINNNNSTISLNVTLPLGRLSINTTNLSLGNHVLKIRLGNEEKQSSFDVATTAVGYRFRSIKETVEATESGLKDMLNKDANLLLLVNKKTDVENALNKLNLKINELRVLENQTSTASEKDKKAEDILNETTILIENLPRFVINRGKASDRQVINLKDLKDLSNFDEKDLFFEQKKISVNVKMDVVETISFSNKKELKTFVSVEATGNDDIEESKFLLLIPNNIRSSIKGIQLNHEKGLQLEKSLDQGTKFNIDFSIDGAYLNRFYDFKLVYIPNKIEPIIKSVCGNNECEIPLENEITCAVDCKKKLPIKFIVIVLVIGVVLSLGIYGFTKFKGSLTKKNNLSGIEMYITNCLKKRLSEATIRKALSEKGWKKEDIDNAFKNVRGRK